MLVNLSSVIEIREPHLDSHDRCPRLSKLVHEADTSDHVCWLDGATDNAKDDVVPILVDDAPTDCGLKLELEVPSTRVDLVLPLRLDTLSENHECIHHAPSTIGTFAHELLAIEKHRGLREVIPILPEAFHRAEGGHAVSRIRILVDLGVRLRDLLPKHPCVLQGRVPLPHLFQLLGTYGLGTRKTGRDLCVEAQVRSLGLVCHVSTKEGEPQRGSVRRALAKDDWQATV